MPLSARSLEFLDKVKKGTPARFVLVTKGVRILNLVVYRKGSLETAKKEAKEAGTGVLSHGNVDGKGQAVSFKLARADGFEQAPVKDLVLKVFLADSNFECKPTIDIVDTLPDLGDHGVSAPPQTPQSSTTATDTTTQQMSPEPQTASYRTQEQWDKILTTLRNGPNSPARQKALEKVALELKRERTQVQNDPLLAGDPSAKQEISGVHVSVAQELKSMMHPPTTGGPPNRVPPQPPPRTVPLTPPPPQKTQEDKDRDTLLSDAKRRAGPFATKIEAPYKGTKLKEIRTECETDETSDFGKVTVVLTVRQNDSYNDTVQKLLAAAQLAQQYIKDHADPKIGKLPSRVIRRRDYCQQFLPKIKTMLDELRTSENAAQAMAQTYGKLLQKGQPIPSGVADEIYKILAKTKLSDGTRAELQRIADEIKAADQARGYAKLANLQSPADLESAEILLSHGCYKAGGGGTSDVRLLRNPDKSVAFAFKGAQGEAVGALDTLQLPPGACATREDLCSTLTQDILAQTGIDFGFPKAQVAKLTDQTGALIEGIRGKTVDPEELTSLIRFNGSQEDIDEVTTCLQEIPDKISAKSLQKVVLFSTLSCQWDCKWGNLMVENETEARPIDGGGSFPTQEAVDSFGQDYDVVPLAIIGLTQYPPTSVMGDKQDQTLPQALQPMDDETVQGLLKLDVDRLVQTLKTRRDEITQNHPDLAPPPHTGGLVDDATIDRLKASIQVAQDILRQNPAQTLVDFATAYQDWWVQWITANRGPNAVLYGAPQPD